MIVNFFEPLTTFELQPEGAIQHFNAKGLSTTWNWYEMLNEQHDRAFTVAKMMDVDLLATIKGELDIAISEGTTFDQFKKNLIPTLQKAGWWGKQEQINPFNGEIQEVQLGSASRLENIFRTNLQSAYAAGHWEAIQRNKGDQPFLMYDAVDDNKTRPEHAANDGKVYPVDHEYWRHYYPPNGWGCRCGVIQMDADEVEAYGLSISEDTRFDTYNWVNPATMETIAVPFGIDPGFDHNPGISYISTLDEFQRDKLTRLDTESQQAALKGIKATKDKAKAKKAAQKQPETAKGASNLEYSDAEAKSVLANYTQDREDYAFYEDADPSAPAFAALTEGHKLAISGYTGPMYDRVNYQLRTNTLKADARAYAELLNEALDNSQKYTGTSTRAIGLGTKEIADWITRHREALTSGKPVSYYTFLSTKKGQKAEFGGDVWLRFENSRKGVDVEKLSQHPWEEEVLFRSGSVFYVKDIYQDPETDKWIITLIDAPDSLDVDGELTFHE